MNLQSHRLQITLINIPVNFLASFTTSTLCHNSISSPNPSVLHYSDLINLAIFNASSKVSFLMIKFRKKNNSGVIHSLGITSFPNDFIIKHKTPLNRLRKKHVMTWRTTRVFSVWIVFVYWNVFCHVVVLIRPVSYPIPIGRLHTLPYNFATIFLLFLHGQSTRTHVKLVFCRDMFLVSNLSKPSLCGYLVRAPLIHQFVHQWSEWHMMLGRSFKEAGSLYYIDCPLPPQNKQKTIHLRKLSWLAGNIHHEWRCIYFLLKLVKKSNVMLV